MRVVVCVILFWCVTFPVVRADDSYSLSTTSSAATAHSLVPALPPSLVRLTPAMSDVILGSYCLYLADSTKALTLNDILSPATQTRFNRSSENIPSFGLVKPTYWFVIHVQNTSPQIDDWLLEIAYPPLDSVEIFTHDSAGKWSSVVMGDLMPFSQRLVKTRTYVVPLQLHDTLVHTIIIRVNTESSMQMPMILRHSVQFAEATTRTELVYGLFFGIMIALVLYNGFLYASLRSLYYAFYTFYIIMATLYLMVLNGYALQYLWSNSPRFVNYLNVGMLGMIISSLSLFAREFLRLRRFSPLMAKAMLVTMAGGLAVVLAGIILPYRTGVQMAVIVNFTTVTLVVVSGAIVWKRGNSSARYFFVAVSFFLSGNIIFVLKTIGFLPSNAFTNHVVEIGLAIEGLLFAFALAERYRQFRIEKEEAQQEALRIEQVAKTELEGKVQERTTELAKTNDEMQRQMVILNDQAIEIEMTNVELQEKNLLLEGLNREKNEFLGVAAHDLKNPLQTIIMNTSMIRRYAERMSDEQRDELLDRVEETSRRMHDIIEKLLDANAIESGTIELKSESVALAREVRSLVQDYMPKAAAKNIKLHFEVQNENLCALADKNRAIQVVENLLSNAIKFSPHDKNVYVRITKDKLLVSHKNALCLTIQDEGPGLSDEDKEKLFGKFARLSARPTGGEHSTGLGLSIVKKLIEAMHGEIWCDSELGKGATFAFRLPSADSTT
jgi:signal transduction histidine kinase